MIKPYEYLDLDKSVIYISSLIIEEIKDINLIKYNELYKKICIMIGEQANENFIYAIDLLFLLGVVRYNNENDILELII